jgi:hypothetical protein
LEWLDLFASSLGAPFSVIEDNRTAQEPDLDGQ